MGKIELDHTGAGSGVTLSSDGTDLLLNGTAVGGGGTALELYAENPSSPTAPSATGANAVAIGSSTVSSGINSISLGRACASNIDSFAAAIGSSSSAYGASGARSVSFGGFAKSTGADSFCIGPNSIASGSRSVSLGSYTQPSGVASLATGLFSGTAIFGKWVHASGQFSSVGDAQTGVVVLRSDTTDATPEALTANNSTAGTTNQIILPNNSAYAFHGTIVARQQASAGTACAAWKVEGLIRREGSAGTTVLVNSATTILDNTPAWGMTLSADTTNGGLKIEVTGAAATNIRWVATINTSEVTY